MLRKLSCAILALTLVTGNVSAQTARPLFVGMGDSIGEGVQSADASYFSQPVSYLSIMAWRTGAPFPLPLIYTTPFGMVGSMFFRFRLDGSVQGLNLAVSGADVNSLLYDRADGVTDSETDLVLSPRIGSQMEIAESLQPIYVACWIGNNDALAAVTSYDQLDGSQLTSVADFTRDFTAIADRLQAAGSKVVFGTIPNVSQIALLLSRDDILAITGSDFGMAPGDQTTVITLMMIGLGILPPDVLRNPSYILSADEASMINTRIADFNNVIKSVAAAHGMGVADINSRFADFVANPPNFFGIPVTRNYLGGLFSLDGVHPSDIANALIANEFLQVFNSQYGANFSLVDLPTQAYFFLTDPFIDKDHDGRVTGRFGAGLLETFAVFLGFSGDTNDFNAAQSAETRPGTAPQNAASASSRATAWFARITPEASQRFLAEYQKATGKNLKALSRAERIQEFRHLFGLQRFDRRGRVQ